MNACSVYDSSMRFSRAIYGICTLVAFLTQQAWLVLALAVIVSLGVFSLKLNFAYQFHAIHLRRVLKEKTLPISKDSGESKFVSGFIGALLFIDFFALYYGTYQGVAWTVLLIVSLLYFLACFAGVCVASLVYAIFKHAFSRPARN